jgi:hypothetical protein
MYRREEEARLFPYISATPENSNNNNNSASRVLATVYNIVVSAHFDNPFRVWLAGWMGGGGVTADHRSRELLCKTCARRTIGI